MANKNLLKLIFVSILICMLATTTWASLHQPLLGWGGLTRGEDRYWTVATFLDAYCGFLTFYVWLFFKERRTLPRVAWFIAVMLLGNMAMSAYVLLQIMRLRPDQDVSSILTTRNS